MEIGKVVLPKKQIEKIPLSHEQGVSVPWGIGPASSVTLQAQSSFISWGISCISC